MITMLRKGNKAAVPRPLQIIDSACSLMAATPSNHISPEREVKRNPLKKRLSEKPPIGGRGLIKNCLKNPLVQQPLLHVKGVCAQIAQTREPEFHGGKKGHQYEQRP